ncbi:mannitol dehydrogenase family protein [Faecalispora anaeroviscerum]|uniref:mannitol dehydrogenase family protein n=1 Tax=Faecalispora anaeroviscerum TaxID=2991836 RepID=UPI0024B9D921|nr:mannitol dehydrogenase family protein [Faecalispora anaeroviscerum]
MKLNREGICQQAQWENAGIHLPRYHIDAMRAQTEAAPQWVHFGAGNIFRGFIAELQQRLLEEGSANTGIVAVETFDDEIIEKIYQPHDNLALLVLMNPDGRLDKTVVGSIACGLSVSSQKEQDWNELRRIFRSPSLQMVSFTITEKGYGLRDMKGELLPVVRQDLQAGPKAPRHAMAIVAALAYERYQAGELPVAFVSMDNCSHNGEKLSSAVLEIARAWQQNGFVPASFTAYIENPAKVGFPWSMIDKITPRPSPVVQQALEEAGVEEMAPVITEKKTFIAPFVNAEVPQYLVVEDQFPNGRPALEKAGVYFTDRITVENTERMKVTTCLNPLHTALAVYGCLLGYDSIAAEMDDPQLKKLVERIGYDEGMPVVVDPGIIHPVDFIHEVIDQRLPNRFIPDMPQRIATDTSQKVAIRFGETIRAYQSREGLDPGTLVYIPLALAGWLRYLLALDDNGQPMEVSADPMREQLQHYLQGIELGNPASYHGQLRPVLENETVFGVNLYQAGLGEKVEDMFKELIAGPHAVRETLKRYML